MVGAALAASACERVAAQPNARPTGARPASPLAANPSKGVWPDVYYRAPGETRQAYAYAATNPRSLSYIPCYCGCAGDGHRNNLDCYVKAFHADGWLTLDAHGLG